MRVSHAMADTLITPINDSFIDFDVLGRIEPTTFAVLEPSHYSELVLEARRQRRLIDQRTTDWVVVRNRLTQLDTRNRRNLEIGLDQLAEKIGFRVAAGISERVVFRELFPSGLTALDALTPRLLGGEPTLSHLSARDEISALVASLNLPADAPRGAGEPKPAESRELPLQGLPAVPAASPPTGALGQPPQLREAG
jgi:chromosome partitioning protein